MKTKNWQPIESAPKDGTKVLLFWHEHASFSFGKRWEAHDCLAIGLWDKLELDEYEEAGEGLYRKVKKPQFEGWRKNEARSLFPVPLKPTHWMPLPEGPRV